MTRIEFCNLLIDNRKKSGCKMKEICFALDVMPTAIYRLEKGGNNFNLTIALRYLEAIGYEIVLRPTNSKKLLLIKDYSDFMTLLKKTRKRFTQRDLATLADCSYAAIANIEQERNIISIDIFIKIIKALGYELTITEQPHEQ